jgi:hypothetical protein
VAFLAAGRDGGAIPENGSTSLLLGVEHLGVVSVPVDFSFSSASNN